MTFCFASSSTERDRGEHTGLTEVKSFDAEWGWAIPQIHPLPPRHTALSLWLHPPRDSGISAVTQACTRLGWPHDGSARCLPSSLGSWVQRILTLCSGEQDADEESNQVRTRRLMDATETYNATVSLTRSKRCWWRKLTQAPPAYLAISWAKRKCFL